jgi:hypothetical protein
MQQYHAALRHRDSVLYFIGALAHWLVLRWEICGETPPDFRYRPSWYTTKVFPGKLSLAQKEIPADTQQSWLVSALEAVAVDSSKAVHAMRQSVARLADMWEVPRDQISIPIPLYLFLFSACSPLLMSWQIQKAGGWEHGAWVISYLARLPRHYIRVVTGFRLAKEIYFLRRS